MSGLDAHETEGAAAIRSLTLYSKPGCHLCVEARAELERLRRQLRFEIHEVDITSDELLHRAYFERIPVVALDGEELFDYFVDEQLLRRRLEPIL
jgi:glutaredoxin